MTPITNCMSLSDSEEETSANDESSDDQTGSENYVVATRNATPTAAKQAAAPSINSYRALSSKVFSTFSGNGQSIVIRL